MLGGAAGAEATGQAAQTHAASAIPARIMPGQTSRSSHAVRMCHLCSEAEEGKRGFYKPLTSGARHADEERPQGRHADEACQWALDRRCAARGQRDAVR